MMISESGFRWDLATLNISGNWPNVINTMILSE